MYANATFHVLVHMLRLQVMATAMVCWHIMLEVDNGEASTTKRRKIDRVRFMIIKMIV
jgi:hypothetical protein